MFLLSSSALIINAQPDPCQTSCCKSWYYPNQDPVLGCFTMLSSERLNNIPGTLFFLDVTILPDQAFCSASFIDNEEHSYHFDLNENCTRFDVNNDWRWTEIIQGFGTDWVTSAWADWFDTPECAPPYEVTPCPRYDKEATKYGVPALGSH